VSVKVPVLRASLAETSRRAERVEEPERGCIRWGTFKVCGSNRGGEGVHS